MVSYLILSSPILSYTTDHYLLSYQSLPRSKTDELGACQARCPPSSASSWGTSLASEIIILCVLCTCTTRNSDLLSRLRNAMRDGVRLKNLSFRMPISHVLELSHVLMHRKLAHAHVHLGLGPVEPPIVVLLKSGIPSNIAGKP
jgi:hypothetical protein